MTKIRVLYREKMTRILKRYLMNYNRLIKKINISGVKEFLY